VVSRIPISGIGPGERLADIDYRHHPSGFIEPPVPPQLFGIGVVDGPSSDTVRVYSIDLLTGVATGIGPGYAAPVPGNRYGIDFNPTVDRIRVVNDGDESFRLNPVSGELAGNDTDLNPAGQAISAVAYDRVHIPSPPVNPAGTTLFGISSTASALGTIGSFSAQPLSANTGQFLNVKALGVTLDPAAPVGFDISTDATAFASLVTASGPALYTVDLAAGTATSIGSLPQPLAGLALVPQSALPPVPVTPAPAPTVALAGVKSKMSFSSFLKGVTFKVTPSEPAAILAQLLGAKKKKKKKLVSFTKILATKSVGLKGGRQTLTLKPRKKLLGKPTKAFKVQLAVSATAANGNVGKATKTIRVSPPKKKKRKS
jgi:hypothetical protein